MKITLIEPFFSGSHKSWAEELQRFSSHEINIISLNGQHWKWRMHGAAITLYNKFKEQTELPDLILVTDMLDLALFKAQMSIEEFPIPIIIYFHENQLTYPWSETDPDISLNRNRHYGFINYSSALIANKVLFNSHYHKNSFVEALPKFLNAFPDHQNIATIKEIEEKSKVMHLGLDLKPFINEKIDLSDDVPIIIWNHRWEYDKNPELFFNSLFQLKKEGIEFQLIVTGESYRKSPKIFNEAKEKLKSEITHWGYVESKEEYIKLIKSSNIIAITSKQDFFGISIVEAIASGTYPLLPNRLSFPELVKDKRYFYNDDKSFLNELRQIIIEEKFKRKDNGIINHIMNFDWSERIKDYDSLFTNIKT